MPSKKPPSEPAPKRSRRKSIAKSRRQTKKLKEAPPLAPAGEPTLPANQNDRREERLVRVSELIGRNDRRIAIALIGEGYFELQRPKGVRKDLARAERLSDDEIKFIETCRRTVCNDRLELKQRWKTLPIPELGNPETTWEWVHRAQSRISDIDEKLQRGMRDTAVVSAFGEIRQFEAMIGRATGVDIDLKRASGGGGAERSPIPDSLAFVGVFLDLDNVPDEVKEKVERDNRDRAERREASRRKTG